MSFKDYKKESREIWGTDEKVSLSIEQIKLGAILRIADATELMAKNYDTLIKDRDTYKRRYDEESQACQKLQRRICALKGVITKLKK